MFAEYLAYLVGELQRTAIRIAEASPRIIAAVAVIVVTLLVGKLIRSVTTKVLRLVGVNVLSRRAGFDRYLKPTELAAGMAELIGALVYWLLLFLGITYALGLVGFESAERLLAGFVLHLPRVFVSIIILVIGVHVAGFLGNLSRRAAQGAGIAYAVWVGRAVNTVVLLITIVTIVEELAVSLDILKVFLYILLGCAAIVLSLGLGVGSIQIGRDLAASVVLRKTLHSGCRLVWKQEAVIVEAVSPVFTLVRSGDHVTHIRNSALMGELTILDNPGESPGQEPSA